MFETTGIVDERLIKEIRKYMITPRQRALLILFSIVAGSFSFLFLVYQSYVLSFACIMAVYCSV
ncbi:MAG: hypothetical protein ACERKZ_04490 [Lachnotalea sp.]